MKKRREENWSISINCSGWRKMKGSIIYIIKNKNGELITDVVSYSQVLKIVKDIS